MDASIDTLYDLYGRKEYPEPLTYVRTVQAAELDHLQERDEPWVELVAVPKSAVVQVIPWEANDEFGG